MAERAAERYLSVGDLLEDLRRLREGLPLRTRPATAAYVARRFLHRNRVVALLASFTGDLIGRRMVARRAGFATCVGPRSRGHEATPIALAHEQRALENEARASTNASQAALNAARLDALVGDLLNDENADPNIVGQQEEAVERSLRRAAASLEALPGPRRWRELSIAWRRLAMMLCTQGRIHRCRNAAEKGTVCGHQWLYAEPSPASRRNALMVKLCGLRLARQRGATEAGTGSRMTPWRISARCLQSYRRNSMARFGWRARACPSPVN